MSYLYEKENRVKITREEYYELIKKGAIKRENVVAIPQRIQNIYSGYRFYACKNYMEKINEKENICIKTN